MTIQSGRRQARPIPDALIDALRGALPDVVAIYVFGSAATGQEHPDSDLDMALLPAGPVDAGALWELGQVLAGSAGRDVDLVDLRSASTVMRAQVIASGERVFCRDVTVCEQYEDFVFSSYARLNEDRGGILRDIQQRGTVYGR